MSVDRRAMLEAATDEIAVHVALGGIVITMSRWDCDSERVCLSVEQARQLAKRLLDSAHQFDHYPKNALPAPRAPK